MFLQGMQVSLKGDSLELFTYHHHFEASGVKIVQNYTDILGAGRDPVFKKTACLEIVRIHG